MEYRAKLLAKSLFFWDLVVVVGIVFSTFCVTYQAVFNASVIWQWPVIYTGDALFLVSMILRFFRSYTNKKGETVTDTESIALHYLQTHFIFDLLSILPLELFALAQGKFNTAFAVAVLRLNRIIRLYRVWSFLCKELSSKKCICCA